MTTQRLENAVIKALCNLDSTLLEPIDENSYYSNQDKQEIIQRFSNLFDKIRLQGVDRLSVKNSKCKFCYPNGKAFSFHNPVTGEFIIRYVIASNGLTEDGEQMYRVEECRNKPISDNIF